MLSPRKSRSVGLPAFFKARGRKAVAAMEFGLLAPVMAILLIAVFNMAKILILWEQCWSAAQSIAESATTLAVQPNSSNALTYAQVNEALSVIFAEMPWVTAGIATGDYTGPHQLPPNSVKAVLSSVDFYPVSSSCTNACPYTTYVRWSKAYADASAGFNSSSGVLRECARPLDPASPVPTNLGSDGINVPDPFVIADVSLTYTPWLFSAFLPTLTVSASAYVPVRSSQAGATASNDDYVAIDDTGDPDGDALCIAPPSTD